MDLSSHGVTDEIQLGCHSHNIGNFLICKLVLPLSINTVESMHDNVTTIMYMLMFSW